MKRIALVIISLGWLVAAASAQVFETLSATELESIFKEEGFSYKVDADGDVLWKVEGRTVLVMRKKEGSTIEFYAAISGSKYTPEKINRWNKGRLFSKTYLDKDGDPVLELDLDLTGGCTRERIVDFVKKCRASYILWVQEVVE